MYTVYIILCILQFVYYVYCIVYIVLYHVYYVVYIILCILILCILYCVLKTLTFIILKCLQKKCTPLGCTAPHYFVYITVCILYFVFFTLYTILYIYHTVYNYPHHPHSDGRAVLCFIDQIITFIVNGSVITHQKSHLYHKINICRSELGRSKFINKHPWNF